MRMRITAQVTAILLIVAGAALASGVAPAWLSMMAGGPGIGEPGGLALIAFGLFQIGRRRGGVRFVAD